MESSQAGEAAHRDTVAALQKELESKEERLSLASAGTDTLQEQMDALQAELETERLNTQRVSPLQVKQEKKCLETMRWLQTIQKLKLVNRTNSRKVVAI